MRRIIFLDIDGVLAGYKFLGTGKGFIDPEKVSLLNQLKDLECEIVISSSWGYDEGRTEKTLKECGLEIPIIGYTTHYHCDWMCRGNEIERWIIENIDTMGTKYGKEYVSKDYRYVIFDDDTDFLLGQKDNLVQSDECTGIVEEDIDKARKILTEE